jgi:hypothetical protein
MTFAFGLNIEHTGLCFEEDDHDDVFVYQIFSFLFLIIFFRILYIMKYINLGFIYADLYIQTVRVSTTYC